MVSMFSSNAVDRGFISGVMVSVLASSAVDRGFISGVMVSMLSSSAVDRGFIGGVMVSMLSLSAVNRGFISGVMALLECSRSWVQSPICSNQRLKFIIGASSQSKEHSGERAKTGWLRIRIMYLSGATCLSTDCCFSELALYKSN
jgi:hypothetical protein